MPLPYKFNKRMTLRKDNDAKKSSLSRTFNTKIQLKKDISMPPKGIIFNYNIQRCSMRTRNENKSIRKENDDDNYMTTGEGNTQLPLNGDPPVVDDGNIVPNKMYKIVLVEGKIMLAEHNGDDIVEEHVEENNADSDSDVEYVDTQKLNQNTSSISENSEITKDVQNNSGDNRTQFIFTNHHNYCVHPNAQNGVVQPASVKTYTRSKDLSEHFMKKLESITGSNSSNNNMYTTKNDLADARRGKAMVLLPLQKYTSLKKKLADMQNEKKKRLALEIKYEREKRKTEKKIVKLNTTAVQTSKCPELEELNMLKRRLEHIFTEAQINVISNSKKLRDIQWSDSEMEKVVFLKQIISHTAYVFLKYKMHFPLPPLTTVKEWMIGKNMYVKPKKKVEKVQKPAESSATDVGEEIGLETTQSTPHLEPDPSTITNESLNIHTAEVSETAQAVNTIINEQQSQDLGFSSSIEVLPTLSVPVDTGEQFVYYTYENNATNGDDANAINYMPDVASVEEIVHSEVVIPPPQTTADVNLRCRLCMRPFDTEQEFKEHLALHYCNTFSTSYLDAVKPFVCEFCNEPVKYRFDLVHHHRIHLGIDCLKCWYPGCSYVGRNMESLKSHHDRHRPASFPCAQCGALFKTRKYLRQHAARRHAARALRRCALCRATCRTLYTYRRHLQAHARPPTIRCVEPGCAEAFYSRASLRRHAAAAHRAAPRRRRCALCPAAYTHEAQLTKHVNKHATHKISHCVRCLKVFYDYGEYYAHCAHHKREENELKCACGQRFTNKEELGRHTLQCAVARVDKDAKKSKRPKLKRKNEENIDEDFDTSSDLSKRRKTKNLAQNTSQVEHIVVPPEKTYERVTKLRHNSEQQAIEYRQQKFIALEATEDDNEKVFTLQMKDKQAISELAKNYSNVKANNPTFIPETDNLSQKSMVLPNQRQTVIQALGNHQESNQKEVEASDSCGQKVIANEDRSYQHDVKFVTENDRGRVISVVNYNLGKVNLVPYDQQKNIETDILRAPENQERTVHASTNQHQFQNIVSVTKGHYPKKLTPIAKGSRLEKIIAMSTRDKIISSPDGSYIKKVLTLPVGSPLKKLKSVSENQVKKEETYKGSLFKKIVTDHESPLQKNVTSREDPEGPVKKIIPVPESPLEEETVIPMEIKKETIATCNEKNTKIDNTLQELPMKKVITIGKANIQTDTAAPKVMNKVIKVQIPGTNTLQKVVALSREQLYAALAWRQKKLIPISTNVNNHDPAVMDTIQVNNIGIVKKSHSEISGHEDTAPMDMPLIDCECGQRGQNVQQNV